MWCILLGTQAWANPSLKCWINMILRYLKVLSLPSMAPCFRSGKAPGDGRSRRNFTCSELICSLERMVYEEYHASYSEIETELLKCTQAILS
jgi:hypothetical protein